MSCTFPSTTTSVPEWLDAINLARYKPNFEAAQIPVSQLPALTDETLQAAGVTLGGHRKRMLLAAKELSGPPAAPSEASSVPGTLPFHPQVITSADVDMDAGSAMDVDTASPRAASRAAAFAAKPAAPQKPPPSSNFAGASAQLAKQQKSNSTSSIYITSTLTKPDTDEVVFCIAAVLHDRICQGEQVGSEARNKYPFFSEDNNPLYAEPSPLSDSDARGSDTDGSDNSMKRAKREIPSEDMIFHTIRSVYECARIPSECLIVSLVYIERLIATSGCPILVTSWRPILLSALILAQKVWDDRSLHNIDFSVFCPMFTLKEINFLEKKFLELIDFDVSISASLYASYYFQLRTLCQRVDREFNLRPMDIEAAAKLEARGLAYQNQFKTENGGNARKHQSDNMIHATPTSSFLQKLCN